MPSEARSATRIPIRARLRTTNISDKQKTQLKICGFMRADDLRAAIDCGIDWFGVNFYPRSKRYLPPALAVSLLAQAGVSNSKIDSSTRFPHRGLVGIFVDPDDALIVEVLRQVPSMQVVQLHGLESPERVAEIRRLIGPQLRLWKTIHMGEQADTLRAKAYNPLCDLLLFDSAQIAVGHDVPGGSGHTFIWQWLSTYDGASPFGLAGGINTENIKDALAFRLNGRSAALIDVASGAENGSPGIKNLAKIRSLLAAVQETL